MYRRGLLLISFVLLLSACAQETLPPVAVSPTPEPVGYVEDVQPILDARCAVCHSCYNAPCQAKFTSFEGVERGATKARVYHGDRLVPAAPTRLFMDAHSTEAWREQGDLEGLEFS